MFDLDIQWGFLRPLQKNTQHRGGSKNTVVEIRPERGGSEHDLPEIARDVREPDGEGHVALKIKPVRIL
jgi:hypothetical protein